jgi:hypothetical protein
LVATLGYQGSHGENSITYGGNLAAHTYGNDVNDFAEDLFTTPSFSNKNYLTGIQHRLNQSFGFIVYATNGPTANYNQL